MEGKKPLFEGIDQVPWEKVDCCSRHPERLKMQLLRTLSEDVETIEDALDHLFEMTWHQATRYDGTVLILPFLIELLEQPLFPLKAKILARFTPYATGFPEYFLPFGVDSYGPPGEDDYPWDHLTYQCLEQDVQRLLPLLNDPDPKVRMHTLEVLGWFGHRATDLLPAVLQHTEAEQRAVQKVHVEISGTPEPKQVECTATQGNPLEQVTLLIVLGLLGRHHLKEQVTDHLRSRLDNLAPAVRLGAAIGLTILEVKDPKAMGRLFEVLSDLHTLFPEFRDLPYWAGNNNTIEALTLWAAQAMVQQPALGSELFRSFVQSPGAVMVQWCEVTRIHPGWSLAHEVLFHRFMFDVQDEENTTGKFKLFETCSRYLLEHPDPYTTSTNGVRK